MEWLTGDKGALDYFFFWTALTVSKEDSSSSESTPSTGKVSGETDSKATESQPAVCLSEGQLTGFGHAKIHPQVHSSKRYSGVPATSDFPHINQQSCSISPSSLPRHRPPPPPLPPQPPSYAQSLAKSQFRQTETPGPVYTPHPTQLLRRIPSSTALSSSSGAASSVTSAFHIYSQKLSRPTSAGQGKHFCPLAIFPKSEFKWICSVRKKILRNGLFTSNHVTMLIICTTLSCQQNST